MGENDKKKKWKRLIRYSILLLIILSCVYSLLSTNIGSNANWWVIARIIDGKEQADGPLFVFGRLYGMDPTDYISLAYYADKERPTVPLFFVMSNFVLPEKEQIDENSWRFPHSGGWSSTSQEAMFEYKGNEIFVPVSIPARSYLWNFPYVKENNVFILSADGGLKRLPVTISTEEQMDKIFNEVVTNRNCVNYKETVLNILRGDSENAEQITPANADKSRN